MKVIEIKKAELTGIRNIIFDLGNVILNLHFEATIEAFKKLGMTDKVIGWDQAYSDPVFYDLELGRISPELFRKRIRQILSDPYLTDEQIDEAWCAMIQDIPIPRIKVLKELKKQYNIYLFSNTNQIHMSYISNQFRRDHGTEFSDLFTKDYYSHEIHERKPDLESYRKVLDLEGIHAAETLFIDDLEKNIIGAREAGLKTIWLRNGIELTDLF